MKKITSLVTVIFILGLLGSCKDEKKYSNTEVKPKIIFTIKFPDTVVVNTEYDGEIKYRSKLDSITTDFGREDKNRYTRFIFTKTNNPNYNLKELKVIAKDSFGAIDNRTIPIYKIKFSKIGTYYIDGYINDMVLIDTVKNKKKSNDLVRLITEDLRVTHKVIVKDK